MRLFKIAFRELRRSWRFGLFFIFNLSLGLTGFVSLEAFKEALQTSLTQNAKAILSADFAVSARRELTQDEVDKMRSVMTGAMEGRTYEFFAMLNSSKGSRLVMVKAIDKTYPFYGELILEKGDVIRNESDKEIFASKSAWIYPELSAQMGLKAGDEIVLGNLKLKVADLVKEDKTQTFRAASLAPRVFVNIDLIPESGLIKFGSTFTSAYLFKLPATANETQLKDAMYAQLTDPVISVETPQSAGEDSGRQLRYLSDYLGLVALVALFMSTLGAAYLYRLFLSQRMKEIAILRTLGLKSREALGVYILQVSILGLVAAIPTIAASYILLPLLSRLLGTLVPFELTPSITLSAALICLGMGVIGSFLVCLPFVVKIYDLKASRLFSEEKFSMGDTQTRWWVYVPMIVMFYFLSVYQAHSWRTGTIFVAALAVVLVALVVLGYGVVSAARMFSNLKSWPLKYSFKSLSRRQGSSLAIFIAMGLGALLINLLPQLKNSLQNEFFIQKDSKVPSLFMFDIQDEQVQGVKDELKANNLEAIGLSPMVRARVLKVNGKDYERKIDEGGFKSREDEREARFRNRGMNLSYRENLSTTEDLVEGRPFSGVFDPEKNSRAELSVEERFAERMDFHIGDVLVFDVQGVEVEGEIVNLRKVRWTSFQPNFFILFQNGALNDAPKTWIAAVPSIADDLREKLQNEMATKFPNVSIIDVVRTVTSVLETAEKMSWSLELMAGLALLTGYIVLYSIVRSQIRMRRWEINMLKILGASHRNMTTFVASEFAFLAFLSALMGAGLSSAVSFALSKFIFEGTYTFSWQGPVISVILISALSGIVALLASFDIVRESPLSILREDKD
jgi:Predicted ABC-type transport system involved in lysophospholipase L1 biosynthesis, permease component